MLLICIYSQSNGYEIGHFKSRFRMGYLDFNSSRFSGGHSLRIYQKVEIIQLL